MTTNIPCEKQTYLDDIKNNTIDEKLTYVMDSVMNFLELFTATNNLSDNRYDLCFFIGIICSETLRQLGGFEPCLKATHIEKSALPNIPNFTYPIYHTWVEFNYKGERKIIDFSKPQFIPNYPELLNNNILPRYREMFTDVEDFIIDKDNFKSVTGTIIEVPRSLLDANTPLTIINKYIDCIKDNNFFKKIVSTEFLNEKYYKFEYIFIKALEINGFDPYNYFNKVNCLLISAAQKALIYNEYEFANELIQRRILI